MSRPESGIAAARLFRWQMMPVSQEFMNELSAEPLSGRFGDHLVPGWLSIGQLGHWHRGVDIACPVGTPIRLVLSGIITVLPFDASGFGNAVQCDGARYRMTYGHLSVVRARSGQKAVHGDLIALSGSTGNSTGPHVHFELWDKDRAAWIDPWLAVTGV